MEKGMIPLSNTKEIIEMLKMVVSNQMIQVENLILSEPLPKREDFQTEEEYNREVKEFMSDAIDVIEDAKKEIFVNVLDSYNDFLVMKNTIESPIKDQNKQAEETAFNAGRSIRNTAIGTAVLTLLLPSLFPIVIVVGVGRIGFKILEVKMCANTVARNMEMEEVLKNLQIPFFDFTCELRTDYHQSNKELKEMRERLENGENIMPDLMELIKPERLSLERVESLPFEEDEQKQYFKQNNI